MSGKIEINIPLYKKLMSSLHDVDGDFAEFGVWYGRTFKHIYTAALWQCRNIHAIDSFVGMPHPILEGDRDYPAGTFSVGDSFQFRENYPRAVIHEGFIPDILAELEDVRFAFAHVDLDHEHSTGLTLEWLWPRMSPGGIMICHDYWPDADKLAAKAINDWMRENNIMLEDVQDYSIWFRHGN